MSYIKNKSFKITSRFYVIYGDYDPVYVGYTNRTVKQRFKEHQKDKDFSEYKNVEVKELVDEKLSFDFTWDYDQTCRNADQVSLREGQLVQQYGTQDSEFQKADGGGQTWAAEKGFAKSNKDNPRFTGMSGADIKACLKEEKVVSVWLSSFVNHMRPVEKVWLSSFVGNMRPVEKVWLSSFVGNMRPTEKVWLSSFVNNMRPVEEVWLNHFVNSMVPAEDMWLHNFVNHMRPAEEVWLSSFINDIRPVEEVWLHNFVNHMKPAEEVWLSSFVGNMKNKRR